LGGVLTPTGLGTIMADGKQIVNVDGKDYLLEKPLKADIAFLRANIVDEFGNNVTDAYVLSYGSYKDGKFQNGKIYRPTEPIVMKEEAN